MNAYPEKNSRDMKMEAAFLEKSESGPANRFEKSNTGSSTNSTRKSGSGYVTYHGRNASLGTVETTQPAQSETEIRRVLHGYCGVL